MTAGTPEGLQELETSLRKLQADVSAGFLQINQAFKELKATKTEVNNLVFDEVKKQKESLSHDIEVKLATPSNLRLSN